MAAKNKYEVLIDFLVDLTMDYGKVNDLAKKVQTEFQKASPEIDLDDAKIKNIVNQIAGSFEDVDKVIQDIEKHVDEIDFDMADKSLDEFENQLKGLTNLDLDLLENALGDLPEEEFEKLKDSLGGIFDDVNPDEVIVDIKKLAKEFDKAEKEIKGMLDTEKKALAQMKLNGQEGTEAYQKLEEEIADAEEQLKKLNAASGASTITEPAEKVGRSLTERVAVYGLAIQGVQQLTGAFEQFLGPYKEFDKQLRNIGTLGIKNFEEFRGKAIDLASSVPDTVAGVTEAVYNAISAGAIEVVDGVADIEGGMKFVEQASKLAVAGLTDTNSAVKGLAANLNAYGESTSQAARYSDILFNTVNNGVTTIPELNASLSNVVPAAAAFGVSFEQVTAAIAAMTQQGVQTATATTQIRGALVELAKPGAALKPIMERAGVSLESLQQEGLQVSLQKLGEEMEKTGVSATQVFGSVEAAGAIMSLSGKNAQRFADILGTYTTDALGSTQRAFDIANAGIGVSAQGVLNQIEAGFFKLFGALGDGFTTMLSLTNQVGPMIMTFGALGQIIPPGSISRVLDYGKSIANVLVPGLFAQTAAQQGATAAQLKFNIAALANPYVAMVAGIAAVATGLYFLIDALHVSTKEQIESAKAEQSLIKTQIESNRTQRDMVKGNLNLVDSFKKQGKSAMENHDLLLQLSKAYPGVIDRTKSYADNLDALEKAAKGSKGELKELKGTFEDLANQQFEIDLKIAKLEVDQAKKDLEDELTEANLSFWEFPISFAIDAVAGTSTARTAAESVLSEYTKKIYKAKDDKDLQKAGLDLQMAIFNNPKFAELDDQEKIALVKKTREMVDLQGKVIKKRSKDIGADLANMVSSGYRDEEIVDLLSKKYKLSKEEVEKMVKAQKDSKTATDEMTDAVKSLSEAWADAKKQTSETLTAQIAELEALVAKGRERTKEENERYKVLLQQTRETVRQQKHQERIEKTTKIIAGLESVAGKSRWERAKQAADLQNKNLDLLYKEDALIWKIILQEENREETDKEHLLTEQQKLKLLQDQEATLKQQLKDKGLLIESDGELIFNPKLRIKDEDKQQITEELLNVAEGIVDQKGVVADIRFKIQDSDDELKKLRAEFEKKKLEFEIKYGLAKPEDILPLLEKDLEEIRNKLNDKEKKLTEKQIIDLQTMELAALDALNSKKEELFQTHLDKIKENYDKYSDEITNKNQDLLSELQEQNAIYFSTIDAIGNDKITKDLDYIDKSEDAKLKKYEEWKELGIITERQFEQKKSDIADEYEAKRIEAQRKAESDKMVMAEFQRAMEVEVIRAGEIEKLTATQRSLQEQINLYKEMSGPKTAQQEKEYEALKNRLDSTNTLIETKGKDIGVIASELGQIANQGLLEGIAGDPEATKKALKKSMAFLAGYLEKKVSAFIIDWLLTPGVTGTFSFLPLPLQAPAFTLASTAITGFVHKIVGPILSKLTSFASGGRIDQPTAIIAGDAKLGGSGTNTEWVMRDADIMATAMVAASYGNANVVNAINSLQSKISNQEIFTEITFDTIRIGLRQAEFASNLTRR